MEQREQATRDRADFEAWYREFPRHEARADAWKAWQQTADVRPPLATLVTAVRMAAVANEWCQSRRRFIPLPASWLRGERWADEFDVPTPKAPEKPQPTEAEVAQREADRMLVMRARAAWGDVTGALTHRSMPLGGWPDPTTARVLERVGGFARICRVATRAELGAIALEFERAWVALREAGGALREPALARRAS